MRLLSLLLIAIPARSQVAQRSAPAVVSKVEPGYPEEARRNHLVGTVLLSVVIGSDGLPRHLRVIRPLGYGFDEKAIEAVTNWRFRAGTRNGEPVDVQATIEVNFRLTGLPPGEWRVTLTSLPPAPGVVPPVLVDVGASRACEGKSGAVTVSFEVNTQGKTGNVRILESTGQSLDVDAERTVQGWQFQPAQQNGAPTGMRVRASLSCGEEPVARL